MKDKKKVKLLRCLPFLALIFSIIVIGIFFLLDGSENEYVSQYARLYFLAKRTWWIYLTFVTIPICSFVLSFFYKDKATMSLSIGVTVILLVFSFSFLHTKGNYSEDKVNLRNIEIATSFEFPESSLIIENKKAESYPQDDDIIIINEGVIYAKTEINFEEYINLDTRWENEIDPSVVEQVPYKFYNLYSSADKFLQTSSTDGTITLLAFKSGWSVISYTTYKIS